MKAHSVTLPEPEWSFFIHVDDIKNGTKTWTISPKENQRIALIDRLGVLDLKSLTADVTVEQEAPHVFYVHGHFKACVVQECVVTTEAIENTVEDDFEAWFSDHEKIANFKKAQHDSKVKKENLEIPMLDEKDDPEPILHDQIDIGEVVTQFVLLSIDPYPQKEGASLPESIVIHTGPQSADKASFERPNPFAALKNWRPKD